MSKKYPDGTKITSYLSSLSFDTSLLRSFQARYLSNLRFVVLLIVSIVVLGTFSFIQIPRRLNPEIKIPIVTIVTALPGATPNDIESLVTIPIEDKVKDLKGIDTLTSTSSENVSVIVMQFTSTTNGDKARDDVEREVRSVSKLPDDAEDPQVTLLDFEDEPVWNFIVYSKHDDSSLMRFAKELKTKVEEVQRVDRVVIAGYDDQYIQVSVKPEQLERYRLSPIVLLQLVKKSTTSYPAGTLDTASGTFSLSIDPSVTTIADIRNIKFEANGEVIKLGDIATISEIAKPEQNEIYFSEKNINPRRGVQFFVYKVSGANIDAAEHDAHVVVDAYVNQHGDQFTVKTVINSAEEITKQFSELFKDFQSTIILVFVLLFIFLGLRQAIIASLTIPLTFLSAFAIISAFGMTLNFLTMFAFLLALGLLIDDTIVAVAAMTRYYKTGKFTPYETGIIVWRDFIVPLWSTTITTIWAFVPLLLSTGIIGEFIKPIPIVVTATMLSSTTIAVLITIPLMTIFLKPQFPKRVKTFFKFIGVAALVIFAFIVSSKNPLFLLTFATFLMFYFVVYRNWRHIIARIKSIRIGSIQVNTLMSKISKTADSGVISVEKMSNRYMIIIRRVLESKSARRNTLIAIGMFVLVAYLLVPFGFVKTEFFPKTNEDVVFINVDMPTGTNNTVLKRKAHALSQKIRSIPEVDFAVVETGQQFNSQSGRSNGPNSFLATLHLVSEKNRKKTSQELADELRNTYRNYQDGVLTVQELSGGPPAGADVQVKLLGDDLSVLNKLADSVIAHLKTQTGIINPDKSIKSGTGKLVFIPDYTKLSQYGVSVDTIGFMLRSYASGLTLDDLRRNKEEVEIHFTYEGIATPDGLSRISIPTPNGYVPLSALGKLLLENNPSQITRESRERTISVFAGVGKGFAVSEKNKEFTAYLEKLKLPEGYRWETGGVNEENNKSVQSIMRAMILSILLILITMVIEFQSFRQSFIALLIIPISIAAVFYIFGLFGIPLSFPALIGILALFGIVVTHVIVVIEKINDNRKEGLELTDAIVDAAGHRLEPVLLTSLATIVGLIPITLSDPLWRGLGGAIIAGLLFSGAIKLFLVPILYFQFFKEEGAVEARG